MYHNLKVVMTAPSQAVLSGYQSLTFRIWNPRFAFFSLHRLSNAQIHPRQMSSSALRYALHTRPLLLSMYPKSSFFVNKYLVFPALLSSLPRHFTQCFTIRLHNPQLFSFCSTFSSGKLDITRWNIVYNDAGHSKIFSTSMKIYEASGNPSSTV